MDISQNKNTNKNPDSNSSGNSPKSRLCCFGYADYIVLASSLAVSLGEELSIQDLSILSTFFAVLSDELALISAVKNCNSSSSNDTFVPPVPDVAMTSTTSKKSKKPIKKRTCKKIVKKKVKKK